MNKMKCKYLSVLASVGLGVLLLLAQTNTALAATAPSLGVATSFGVLGHETVTNAGPVGTVINGDLGLYSGTSITGFAIPPNNTVVGPGILTDGSGLVTGTIHITDGVAQQAQVDALAAYNNLTGQSFTQNLSGQDLDGMTLAPGVYYFSSDAYLRGGTLTLDAKNNPDSVFIFQIGSALTVLPGSSVVEINAPAGFCNKYWRVGSSATLDVGSSFRGNILALASITMNNGASLYGRALALTGAVTLINNVVTVPSVVCSTTPFPTPTLSGWGLILLTGLLVSVGFFTLRKSGKLRLG